MTQSEWPRREYAGEASQFVIFLRPGTRLIGSAHYTHAQSKRYAVFNIFSRNPKMRLDRTTAVTVGHDLFEFSDARSRDGISLSATVRNNRGFASPP